MRTLLIALFATAAVPAAALAQDTRVADSHAGADTQVRTEVAQASPRGEWRGGGRGDRAARSVPSGDAGARPARNWGGSSDGQARPQRNWGNDGAARPQRNWGGDGNRGRRFEGGAVNQPAPVQTQVAPPTQDTQRGLGRRNWGGDAPRIDPGRGDGRTGDWNRGANGRRDWDQNDDGRPDWNRRGEGRRDWDRNNDGRRDWNRSDNDRRDWSRNDGRRDWSDNRRDFRQWDRGWRNNSRYDWQRYRSSNRYAYRLPRYAAPYGWNYGYRRFSIGAYLFAGLFAQDYWINDPWAYRLPPVYWPYQWVRYYNDALLIDTRSGYVVDSIPDIFWY